MSEEQGGAPAAPESAPQAGEGGAPGASGGGAQLSAEDLDAIASAGGAKSRATPSAGEGSSEETVRIGDHDVPVAVLDQIPDDVLKRIRRKVKVDGEELEVTLAEALEKLPLGKAAQKRMWEASQQRKRLEQAARLFSEDPVEAYSRMHGISREQALDRLTMQLSPDLERAAMTPEQQQEWDRYRELQRKAALADQYAEQERKTVHEQQTAKARQSAEDGIKAAFQAVGSKPTMYALQRVAHLLDTAYRDGTIQGAASRKDYEWAVGRVVAEVGEEHGARFHGLEGDELIDAIGEEEALRISRAVAKRIRSRQSAPVAPVGTRAPAERRSDPSKITSWREWQRQADARTRNR